MKKEIIKRAVDFVKVFITDTSLVFSAPSFYPLHQDICPGLEEDDQVWSGESALEEAVELLVEPELLFIQVGPGKNTVFVKKIIRYQNPVKETDLIDLPGDLIPPEEKEDLGLKPVFSRISIKIRQEWIFIDILEEGFSLEPLCKHSGKACFSDSQGTFNNDVIVRTLFDAVHFISLEGFFVCLACLIQWDHILILENRIYYQLKDVLSSIHLISHSFLSAEAKSMKLSIVSVSALRLDSIPHPLRADPICSLSWKGKEAMREF